MKKILITGSGSYIGTSFEKWLRQWSGEYFTDTVDMMDDSWRQKDFSGFDAVFHVAAIVHIKESPGVESSYYKVNRDLAVETARKAKEEGVGQFIFMSTMAVYGQEGRLGENITITRDTQPAPRTFYGKSKLFAELELEKLCGDGFNLVVIRAPMVYGPDCPGNYAKLLKLASRTPVFPMIDNKRSMLHIHKLCECIKDYIDSEAQGLFFPQDDEYANTSLLVKKLAQEHGRNIHLSRVMGFLVRLFGTRIDTVNKVFGNLVYER